MYSRKGVHYIKQISNILIKMFLPDQSVKLMIILLLQYSFHTMQYYISLAVFINLTRVRLINKSYITQMLIHHADRRSCLLNSLMAGALTSLNLWMRSVSKVDCPPVQSLAHLDRTGYIFSNLSFGQVKLMSSLLASIAMLVALTTQDG